MKQRFRMFRRGNYFWAHDGLTGKQETLRTKDKTTGLRLLHAKNEAHQQPAVNLQIARAYLAASDPQIVKRTWQTQQVAFDALHRVTLVTNMLGRFTNTYVGGTMLLSTNFYPNGQQTVFSYLSVTNDERLQTIWNRNTTNGTLSKFDYAYDPVGQITNWTEQADTNTATVYNYGYDAGNQLINAVLKSTGAGAAVLKQYAYGYDLAGNRTAEQIGTGTSGPVAISQSGYNNDNQVTGRTGGSGSMLFAGILNEQATVSVGGNPATVNHATTNFVGYASVTNGTNVVPIIATDYSNNSRTNKYQLVVTNNGVGVAIAYDSDGNETNAVTATSTNSYQFDAANRLVSVTGPTNQSLFTYDGLGRRVQIIEKTNGVAYVTNKFIWDGTTLCEQRNNTGSTVTKRFFGEGEQISGTNYFFTRDHLGSIREMTDSGGITKVRYDYDSYGRQTKISGTMDADFGYAGMYYEAADGLNLTLYRAYSADLGRWLSRDPAQEFGGLNLYEYVANNPANLIDPLGLIDCAALAAAIARMENLVDNALKSMSDINEEFDRAKDMNIEAAAINGLWLAYGAESLTVGLEENTWKYVFRIPEMGGAAAAAARNTDAAAIIFTEAGEHGAIDAINKMGGLHDGTPITLLNPFEGMTEGINNMGENMSDSTYQTILGLQAQLAALMDLFNVCCK